MGCANNSFKKPSFTPENSTIKRYLTMMQLDNPININKRYEHISRLYPQQIVGAGLKQTCAYECLMTRNEMLAKRVQYWETRTHGKKNCWTAMREVVEQPMDDAKILKKLRMNGLAPLNNSLQMCVDEGMVKYEIPVFCINQAKNYSLKTAAMINLKNSYVKIRWVKTPSDVVINTNTDHVVSAVKEMYRVQASIPLTAKIRFMYAGKQMLDTMPIGSYNLTNQAIIQAMVIGA